MARAGPLSWDETGEGPAGETGAHRRRSRRLGRRDPGAQGDADQLPSRGGGRRRRAGRHRCGARPGPVSRDQRAPAAAGAARPAGAALPPSPADPRRRRQQAVQIDRGHRPARIARAGHDARPISAAWSGSIDCTLPWHPRRRGWGDGWRSSQAQAAQAPQAAQARRKASAPPPRAIEAALAGIAHDIRTPLTGILALAELLAASDLRRARAANGRSAIKSGADHLAALTTLIVDAAKAEATGLVLRDEPFSPRALAQAVAHGARCARRQQERQSRDRYRARSAGRWSRRRAAAAGALENLADNAVKFTERRRGAVCRRGGAGRAPARAAHVHGHRQRHRAHGRRAQAAVPSVRAGERGGGAALRRRRLGLVFVKRIAKAMGGELKVTSRRPRQHVSSDRAGRGRSRRGRRRRRTARATRRRARSRCCAPRTIRTAAW